MKITQSVRAGAIIITLIGIGFFNGYITVENTQQNTTSSIKTVERSNQGLLNITGTLTTTPDLEKKWIALVEETDMEIIGQVYNFTNKNIKKLIKKKADQGTSIQMIVENRQYKSFGNQFEDLKEEFMPYSTVAFKSDSALDTQYAHAKFRVTDKHSIIQTANLTHGGLNQSKEHMFSSTNKELHKSLTVIFNQDRNKGENNEQSLSEEEIIPNLLICPINCRSGLEKLLKEATSSIVIWNQYITDQSIWNILKQQHKEGVALQLLVSDSDSNSDLLRYFDEQIVRQVANPYMHTKTILIDDTYLVIGSINFSSNSMDNNRELAIILIDPELIQEWKSDFDYYWEQG